MKIIIIQGSSRSKGNTSEIVNFFRIHLKADVLDLRTKNITPYDYEHANREDDFLPAVREIVNYDLIIFITPVYWYSMSGLMKNFLDRLTDCLKIEKDTGRKLRGKAMAVIACGSENTETHGFFEPFRLSAAYLGMDYLGSLHTWLNGEPEHEMLHSIEAFAKGLKRQRMSIKNSV